MINPDWLVVKMNGLWLSHSVGNFMFSQVTFTHSLHDFSEGLGELNHQPVFPCFSQWKLHLFGGFPSLPLDGLSFHCKMVIDSECMTSYRQSQNLTDLNSFRSCGPSPVWTVWTVWQVDIKETNINERETLFLQDFWIPPGRFWKIFLGLWWFEMNRSDEEFFQF